MSARRWILVVLGLCALIAISIPRYVDGFTSSDYARAAQMVAVVWLGFFLTARRWAKDDPRAQRILTGAAAIICIPPLAYHLYDSYVFKHIAGNLVLLAGIAFYTYGKLLRREPG